MQKHQQWCDRLIYHSCDAISMRSRYCDIPVWQLVLGTVKCGLQFTFIVASLRWPIQREHVRIERERDVLVQMLKDNSSIGRQDCCYRNYLPLERHKVKLGEASFAVAPTSHTNRNDTHTCSGICQQRHRSTEY